MCNSGRVVVMWRTGTHLVVGGLRDVNGQRRHISGLPGSSEDVHEVVIEVPYEKSHRGVKSFSVRY